MERKADKNGTIPDPKQTSVRHSAGSLWFYHAWPPNQLAFTNNFAASISSRTQIQPKAWKQSVIAIRLSINSTFWGRHKRRWDHQARAEGGCHNLMEEHHRGRCEATADVNVSNSSGRFWLRRILHKILNEDSGWLHARQFSYVVLCAFCFWNGSNPQLPLLWIWLVLCGIWRAEPEEQNCPNTHSLDFP